MSRLDEILDALLLGKVDECVVDFTEREKQDPTLSKLYEICLMIQQCNEFSIKLAKGEFSAQPPPKENYMAMSVKNLHSKLRHLLWQLDQIAKGDYSQVVDYMGELSEGFNWMTRQLQLRKIQAEYELNHDPFTGLLNREAFVREVQNVIATVPQKKGAMMYCGLDNIKFMNDTYGYEVGDQYIAAAAEIFDQFKKVQGLVARISGDEFAVYIHGYSSGEEVNRLLEEFYETTLKQHSVELDGKPHKIRSSHGVSLYPDDASTVNELMKYAHYAMYEAKMNDRGTMLRFDSITYYKKAQLFEKHEALNRLLEGNLIQFAFQPIVDLSSGSIYGYEALMRPMTKEFSSPLEILNIATNQSKLSQVEGMTFELIFQWLEQNLHVLQDRKLFFNTITGRYFDEEVMESVNKDFKSLIPHMVFEILETNVDEDTFTKNITDFRRDYNMMVAIDDYGCGYSNDFRLLNLAPNILKIDRFFIKDVHKSLDKQMILSNILSFCSSKSIRVLAEGIETREELQVVIELGFHYAQGYYLGRPGFELAEVEEEKQQWICQGALARKQP